MLENEKCAWKGTNKTYKKIFEKNNSKTSLHLKLQHTLVHCSKYMDANPRRLKQVMNSIQLVNEIGICKKLYIGNNEWKNFMIKVWSCRVLVSRKKEDSRNLFFSISVIISQVVSLFKIF